MNQLSRVLLSSLILALVACSEKQEDSKPEMPATTVSATQVEQLLWSDEISVTGSLSSYAGVTLRTETAGVIEAIYFNAGDTVTAGTPLVQLNADLVKAELAHNHAQYSLAQSEFKRTKTLFDQGTVTQSVLDIAQAKLDAAHAQVDQSQARVDQTLVRATIDGKLGLETVSVGDYVIANTEIVALQDYDPIYVDFNVPEIFLSAIKSGAPLTATSVTYPSQSFKGKVDAIDSRVKTNSRSLAVRGLIENPDELLIPGGFVEVKIQLKQHRQVVIPQIAVVYGPEGNSVYVIENGQAFKRPIATGNRKGDLVAVNEGLQEGETIITMGQAKIYFDGAPVTITNNQ